MTSAARLSIAGLVVVVAAVVALWPRSDEPAEESAPESPDLDAVRAQADLSACPSGTGGPGQVAGVTVECLADGADVDLGSVLAGGPVLVNVWATWCEPCREELPLLAEYAAEPDAVPVVGLAVESTADGALELLTALEVRLPTVLDEDGAAQRALRLPVGLPASYVVDGGEVRLVENPRLFRTVDEVRRAVGAA